MPYEPEVLCSEPTDCTDDEECPICCHSFPQFNFFRCCNKHICTECVIQLWGSTNGDMPCPFCKTPGSQTRIHVRPPSLGCTIDAINVYIHHICMYTIEIRAVVYLTSVYLTAWRCTFRPNSHSTALWKQSSSLHC